MLNIILGGCVLLQLSTLTFSVDSSSCVDNYLDFEEQTFGNNSENRLKLYEAFYPPNDHLPYSVVVTYQAVLPNGTRVNISIDSTCPDRQVWLWLSSPILLLSEPTELNRLALYTLNYFTDWVPPHLIITTPLPCPAKAEGFLTLMTSSVSVRRSLMHIIREVLYIGHIVLFHVHPASGICFGRDVKGRALGIFTACMHHWHTHCFFEGSKLHSSLV